MDKKKQLVLGWLNYVDHLEAKYATALQHLEWNRDKVANNKIH